MAINTRETRRRPPKYSADTVEEEHRRQRQLAKDLWPTQFAERSREGEASSERVEERERRGKSQVS